MIAATRYTEEHNTPAMQLIEHMRLRQGEKQVTVPKVGQMTRAMGVLYSKYMTSVPMRSANILRTM